MGMNVLSVSNEKGIVMEWIAHCNPPQEFSFSILCKTEVSIDEVPQVK